MNEKIRRAISRAHLGYRRGKDWRETGGRWGLGLGEGDGDGGTHLGSAGKVGKGRGCWLSTHHSAEHGSHGLGREDESKVLNLRLLKNSRTKLTLHGCQAF